MLVNWWGHPFYSNAPLYSVLLAIAVIWTMVWKGIALWRAGRNGNMVWFIVMFILNTLGIVEIVYIFVFSRRKEMQQVL